MAGKKREQQAAEDASERRIDQVTGGKPAKDTDEALQRVLDLADDTPAPDPKTPKGGS
jgi:hypothetical protein